MEAEFIQCFIQPELGGLICILMIFFNFHCCPSGKEIKGEDRFHYWIDNLFNSSMKNKDVYYKNRGDWNKIISDGNLS